MFEQIVLFEKIMLVKIDKKKWQSKIWLWGLVLYLLYWLVKGCLVDLKQREKYKQVKAHQNI